MIYRQVAVIINVLLRFVINSCLYEGRLKSLWTGGSTPLLCRGRRWLLCQVVVVGVT